MINAIVTGGSRGIGEAIAVTLAKNGVNVVLTYKTSKKKANSVVKEIESKGGKAACLQLDQGDRKAIHRLVKTARKELGRISILINNAAITQKKSFREISDRDWDKMMAVNLRGPFILSRELIPDMIKKRWGRIVNISSIGGQWGGLHQVHYAAAKAGLINLTMSLARIYSKDGITTNAIAPGLVFTDMIKPMLKTEAGRKELDKIPLGRAATTKEIADAVAFLCSDDASYITGQTINVNGGMYFG